MSTHRVEEIVKHGDTDTTAPLAHGGNHAPLSTLGIKPLHAGDGITTAPSANYRGDEMESFMIGGKKSSYDTSYTAFYD